MNSKRNIFFYLSAVVWGVLVMALVIYLFFPYQKALRIALQNTAPGGRAAISTEGVTVKLTGIKASKILFRPDPSTEGTTPFELSNVEILWNPLSLLKGKVTIYSKAALYEGMLRCTVEGVSFVGPSDSRMSLKFDHVNLGKCPEGVFPWFAGMSGTLDGTMNKQTPMGKTERETGVFRLDIKNGEIKGIQVKNMPKLIIPYKEIVVEGKIDGPRRKINRLALKSDVIAIAGAGEVQLGETDGAIDMKLSYRVLSRSFPLQGSGTLTVSGSPASPVVAVSPPETAKPGPVSGTLSRPGGA
jgi:type II secretion system protein N